MGFNRNNAPDFKGLFKLHLDFKSQGRDTTFTFGHALLKKAILKGKVAKGVHIFSVTVCRLGVKK